MAMEYLRIREIFLCKGHSTSYSGDCAHCRKLSHDEETSQKNTRLLGGIYICGNRTPLYYSYSR